MNKVLLLARDEEGMTLVELLAVIVILSIVAAIGGVAIAGVIQRSREDARVADIQMLYEAATLAESSDSYISKNTVGASGTTGAKVVTAADLKDKSYSTSVAFLVGEDGKTSTAKNVTFNLKAGEKGAADRLIMNIPEKVTYAGSKANVKLENKDAEGIKTLTRSTVFG